MTAETSNGEHLGAIVDSMRLAFGLWRFRRAIGLATLVAAGAGVVLAKTVIPAEYQAQSVLECDRCTTPEFGDRELSTLQESVKLPAHLEKAREKAGVDATIEALGRRVEVNSSLESRLIIVTARGKSGREAATLADVIVESLLETRATVEQDKRRSHARSLAADAEKARAAVVDARARYDRFRAENRISDLSAERQAAIQEAARLQTEAGLARAQEEAEEARAMALSRATSAEKRTTELQHVEEEPTAKRLAEVKAELDTAQARFSPDHPRVLALNAEIERLELHTAKPGEPLITTRTVGRNPQWDTARQGVLQASAEQEASAKRRATYVDLATAATEAAARLSAIEGQASELLSNLRITEHHLEMVELDLKLAEDVARDPSTGLRILSQARVPDVPIKSSRRTVVFLAPLVGLLISVLSVLLRTLRGARVFTAVELAYWGRAPVLGTAPPLGAEEAWNHFVGDLVVPLRYSHGKTALLGTSAIEAEHARILSDSLSTRLREEEPSSEARALMFVADNDTIHAARRAVREADRAILLVASGVHSAFELRALVNRMGGPGRIAFVLVDIAPDLAAFTDSVGDANAFWRACRGSLWRRSSRGLLRGRRSQVRAPRL